ncbi:S-formylglutathione hydrolase [Allopusillimonas soli]|uniref:S-formylglutathione hydrolase n=1 Tax=Allopusillimonas soli TaxID=659016 RepID=A0A853F9G2_9BURK|nr:S-formylglutathione hydrolase [Allopusillimonas soli]NYT37325.1 S-formylglutathione hydrolase [Allopusillimonas soli]TEA74880.1 S-formylglutathione hydrolase [Allopusillimonas soli]
MHTLDIVSEHRCFDGIQRYYSHVSRSVGLPMRFSVYLPPQAEEGPVPVLFYLAGLTCTEETFMIKAGAQRFAAQHGLMLVAPDTSPRGAGIPGEDDDWDLGTGAGFYLDATQAPWSGHYRMDSYISDELFGIVTSQLPGNADRAGIFGHSMGGHGALVLAQKYRGRFQSVSAFAPIAAPTRCPWGEKAFGAYLGPDRQTWAQYDASLLMEQSQCPFPQGILIDQGLADGFLAEQLHPQAFEAACAQAQQPLILRRHDGYDHGYYFIATFMEDHMAFHAERLARSA